MHLAALTDRSPSVDRLPGLYENNKRHYQQLSMYSNLQMFKYGYELGNAVMTFFSFSFCPKVTDG